MSKSSPAYRGIYCFDKANKPNGTSVKQNPAYRGIYAKRVAKAADGNPATAAPTPETP